MKPVESYKKMALLPVLAMVAMSSQAQSFRSTYFMDGDNYRHRFLNPAFLSDKGWVAPPIPGGALSATMNSSSIGIRNIKKIVENKSESDYFKEKSFLNDLDVTNRLNANLDWSLCSVGWYSGKNLWSVSIGLRNTMGASVSKSLFEFMNTMDNVTANDWNTLKDINANTGSQSVRVMSYGEISASYSRRINDNFSVGGRVKALIGIGNFRMDIENIHVQSQIDGLQDAQAEYHLNPRGTMKGKADIHVDATMQYSTKLLELTQEKDKGYITDMGFGSIGFAGYGMAVDLGISYKPIRQLTLSASVLDLGSIRWSKNDTRYAESRGTDSFSFDENNTSEAHEFANLVHSKKLLNYDLMKMEVDEDKSRSYTTKLHSTVLVGAEYALSHKLAIGALYSGRFVYPKTLNEINLSIGYHRSPMQSIVFNYSVWQGRGMGKTFGMAIKFGCLRIGTDYMYLGRKSQNINAFIGFSIP